MRKKILLENLHFPFKFLYIFYLLFFYAAEPFIHSFISFHYISNLLSHKINKNSKYPFYIYGHSQLVDYSQLTYNIQASFQTHTMKHQTCVT